MSSTATQPSDNKPTSTTPSTNGAKIDLEKAPIADVLTHLQVDASHGLRLMR